MKKGVVVFAVLFLISVFLISGILAANTVNVQKAYSCLDSQINSTGCASMSIQNQIFSLLSGGKCQSELMKSAIHVSGNETCWPKMKGETFCDLQTTSEALLALNKAGASTSDVSNWIYSKKGISKDLNWYLEVDSNNPVSCKVSYQGSSPSTNDYSFNTLSNKSLSGDGGPCLKFVNNNSWFSISKDCYNQEFKIACNDTFISTLLYQNPNSSTYNLLPIVQSSTGGPTYEKIDSMCFYNNAGICDYVGTLWSSYALNVLGDNVSSYLPYLTSLEKDHANLFPDPFLYVLTNLLEYKTNILNQQVQNDYWWDVTGNGKYFDTALALLPFQGSNITQKQNAIGWLADYQQKDGCWDNGNIVSNSLLLYSLWPSTSGNPGTGGGGGGVLTQCASAGYQCKDFASSCTTAGGNIISNLSCGAPGTTQVCCDISPAPVTCASQNGTVCASNQGCQGGQGLQTSDISYGQTCCLKPGTCIIKNTTQQTPSCVNNAGLCETSCPTGYTSTSQYQCSDSQNLCCIQSSTPPQKSYWWLWVLFILIVVVVLGIVYREKIKEFLQKRKARRETGGKSNSSSGPRGPPPRAPPTYRRETRFGAPPQRKIIPKGNPRPPANRAPPQRRSHDELNDVLKKLKEIGK